MDNGTGYKQFELAEKQKDEPDQLEAGDSTAAKPETGPDTLRNPGRQALHARLSPRKGTTQTVHQNRAGREITIEYTKL